MSQLGLVAKLWQSRLGELRDSPTLREFNTRLARRWSIETGIIENIYRIDRGITELLVERGIEAALIPHGSTDKPALDIVRILKDHSDTLEGLFDFVSGGRELSISYIRQLHQQLCASQETVVGVTPDGRRVERPLKKGQWKTLPNNPRRADGSTHEYCPPEHVDSEMERLVELHKTHVSMDVPPEVEAAWLHHRFTQIHPFEDGNGRVARCLASLVLLKAGLFPFTVNREEQGVYIDSLETADRKENLAPLIELIASQQQQTLLEAIDLARDVMREHDVADTLEKTLREAAGKLKAKEYNKQQQEFQQIQVRTQDLISLTTDRLRGIAQSMTDNLGDLTSSYRFDVHESFPDQTHWFRHQVIEVAKELRYYANTYDWHRWVRLRIDGEHGGQIVITFHQSGREFRGVFISSAFYEDRSSDETDNGLVFKGIVETAFIITNNEPIDQQKDRFREWLDEAVTRGAREWSNSI